MSGVLGMMTGALGGSFIDSINNAQNSASQINHNQNIINQQTAASKELTKFQQDEAFKMWKKTNYKAQVEEMKKAGLNIGMMTGGGAGGGGSATVSAGGSPSGGGYQQTNNAGMGLQAGLNAMQTEAQIELLKAQALKEKASAENLGANTDTTNKSRDIMIENLRQSGIETWLNNISHKIRLEGSPEENEVKIIRNAIYNTGVGYDSQAPEIKQLNAVLLKTIAEEKNLNTGSELNDQRIQGYWQELMNATAHAEADKVRAAAMKLQAEWGTGEFVNWKTWADYAESALGILKGALPTRGKTTTTYSDGYNGSGEFSTRTKTITK